MSLRLDRFVAVIHLVLTFMTEGLIAIGLVAKRRVKAFTSLSKSQYFLTLLYTTLSVGFRVDEGKLEGVSRGGQQE